MAKLIRLDRERRVKREIFFSKRELGQILSAYSVGVIKGSWRDYAIDRHGDVATFSIFRSVGEHPIYSFVKVVRTGQSEPVFVLYRGSKTVLSSPSLTRIIDRFETLPRLVQI